MLSVSRSLLFVRKPGFDPARAAFDEPKKDDLDFVHTRFLFCQLCVERNDWMYSPRLSLLSAGTLAA